MAFFWPKFMAVRPQKKISAKDKFLPNLFELLWRVFGHLPSAILYASRERCMYAICCLLAIWSPISDATTSLLVLISLPNPKIYSIVCMYSYCWCDKIVLHCIILSYKILRRKLLFRYSRYPHSKKVITLFIRIKIFCLLKNVYFLNIKFLRCLIQPLIL